MRERFIRYIEHEKRYSENTVKAYQKDLEQFYTFLKKSYDLEDASSADHFMIRSWLVQLIDNKISKRSVNRKITALKSFYKFLVRQNAISVSPMAKVISPKSGKSLPAFIKEQEMSALLTETDFGKGFEAVRNKFMIETFYYTGMRRAELINLKTEDVDLNSGIMKITGKRNKQRTIPIPGKLRSSLENYLTGRAAQLTESASDSPYLFITAAGKQTYPKLVYRIITKHLAYVSANSKKNPHTLRHSFATAMLNRGADLNAIKEILGHANLAATQVYTHNTIEKLQSIYKQAHPRA